VKKQLVIIAELLVVVIAVAAGNAYLDIRYTKYNRAEPTA